MEKKLTKKRKMSILLASKNGRKITAEEMYESYQLTEDRVASLC